MRERRLLVLVINRFITDQTVILFVEKYIFVMNLARNIKLVYKSIL